MGLLGKIFRKHSKQARLGNNAARYEFDHNYAEAAKARAEQATLAFSDKENRLIFSDYCLDSAKNWLKARNPEEALNEGRRALQGFMVDDWLNPVDDEDGENLKELTDLVGDMRRAGYLTESDLFLSDINKALVSIGQKPVSLLVMSDENKFPADCPHCGAVVTYTGNLDSIDCPFCGGVVNKL